MRLLLPFVVLLLPFASHALLEYLDKFYGFLPTAPSLTTSLCVTATITCKITSPTTPYCIFAQYREVEKFTWPDVLHTMKYYCTTSNKVQGRAKFYVWGSDEIFDENYEVDVLYYHNCSDNGQILRYGEDLPEVAVGSSGYIHRMSIDLTNNDNRPMLSRLLNLWTDERADKWIKEGYLYPHQIPKVDPEWKVLS